MYGKLMCALVGSAMLQGCMTSHVRWVDEQPAEAKSEGSYFIKSGEMEPVDLSLITQAKPDAKEVPTMGTALPVSIKVDAARGRDTTGPCATVNNILSICTLGIWPYVKSQQDTYKITVTPQVGDAVTTSVTVSERTWSSFLLPIGALPCPGIGDERGFGDSAGFAGFGERVGGKALAGAMNKGFYDAKMLAYVQDRQNWHDKKQKAIKAIQAVLESHAK